MATVTLDDTNRESNHSRLKLWMHVGVWILVFIIHTLIFSRLYSISLGLVRGVFNVAPMALLFYVNLGLVNSYFENKRYGRFLVLSGLLLILLTAFRVRVNLLFPEVTPGMLPSSDLIAWQFGAVTTNIGVWMLSVLYQVIRNRDDNELRNLAIISRQQEAQLQALRAQINPHFLFNTLNNIYSLAVIRSEKTADMVLKLSNLLRYVTYEEVGRSVALQREVDHIRQYVDLFQLRSETPLDINFEVQGSFEGIKVEPMILIPIVENCFKHCNFDTNSGAYVRIQLIVKGNDISFYTQNTKNDADRQKDEVGGVGLENIRRRLELLYPGRYELVISNTDTTFEVKLSLSYHE
ncbi:MAG: histidine kinase [Saprospiraceae bacterium]|nr:histidine kinase [Saprospiraceae bacterium]